MCVYVYIYTFIQTYTYTHDRSPYRSLATLSASLPSSWDNPNLTCGLGLTWVRGYRCARVNPYLDLYINPRSLSL